MTLDRLAIAGAPAPTRLSARASDGRKPGDLVDVTYAEGVAIPGDEPTE